MTAPSRHTMSRTPLVTDRLPLTVDIAIPPDLDPSPTKQYCPNLHEKPILGLTTIWPPTYLDQHILDWVSQEILTVDHVGMPLTKIRDAIDEAAHEWLAVERQIELLQKLQERAAQLQTFITLGNTLLGNEATGSSTTPLNVPLNSTPHVHVFSENGVEKRTVRALVMALVKEMGRPMRAAEVAQILRERGVGHGQWFPEVVRTALARGHEFERIALGVYALKEWPPERKRWPQDTRSKLRSHRRGRRNRRPRKPQRSLTEAILEALNSSHDEMTIPDMQRHIQQTGFTLLHINSVSGTLSRLVQEGRISKTGPGKYAVNTRDERTADNASELTLSAKTSE